MKCEWGNWSEWTTCSKSCGGGTRDKTKKRLRSDVNDPQKGKDCPDTEGPNPKTESETCKNYPCQGKDQTCTHIKIVNKNGIEIKK